MFCTLHFSDYVKQVKHFWQVHSLGNSMHLRLHLLVSLWLDLAYTSWAVIIYRWRCVLFRTSHLKAHMLTCPSLAMLIWITQSRCCLLYQLVFSLQLISHLCGEILRPCKHPAPYQLPYRFSTYFPEPIFLLWWLQNDDFQT